nr:RcnB family protein [uncultured Sphingomonas sp.]
MKKFILAAVAASTLFSGTAMAAPYQRGDDRGPVEYRQDHRGHQQVQVRKVKQVTTRQFRRGDRFDQRYARNYREIRSPRAYNLRQPARGYRWVQNGDDALLVGITSGIIAAIVANAF